MFKRGDFWDGDYVDTTLRLRPYSPATPRTPHTPHSAESHTTEWPRELRPGRSGLNFGPFPSSATRYGPDVVPYSPSAETQQPFQPLSPAVKHKEQIPEAVVRSSLPTALVPEGTSRLVRKAKGKAQSVASNIVRSQSSDDDDSDVVISSSSKEWEDARSARWKHVPVVHSKLQPQRASDRTQSPLPNPHGARQAGSDVPHGLILESGTTAVDTKAKLLADWIDYSHMYLGKPIPTVVTQGTFFPYLARDWQDRIDALNSIRK